jgi:hypothetical protein
MKVTSDAGGRLPYEPKGWGPFKIPMAPWRAEVWLERIEGRLEVVKLTVGRLDGGAIRAADIHEFRLGEAAAAARKWFAETTQTAAAAEVDDLGRRLSKESRARWKNLAAISAADSAARKPPGRPPLYGQDHWREVARIYRATAGGQPVRAISEHFGSSRTAASAWVREARRLKLLGPAPSRGRAGEIRRRKGKGKQ